MITRLEARDFCCLRHTTQDLGRFHVLIGPNQPCSLFGHRCRVSRVPKLVELSRKHCPHVLRMLEF